MVSQSFLAFGDILELHRKFLELSGGINRIFELEELLDADQNGISKHVFQRLLAIRIFNQISLCSYLELFCYHFLFCHVS